MKKYKIVKFLLSTFLSINILSSTNVLHAIPKGKKLEPFYLNNILLYLEGTENKINFKMVSKNCDVAACQTRIYDARKDFYYPNPIFHYVTNLKDLNENFSEQKFKNTIEKISKLCPNVETLILPSNQLTLDRIGFIHTFCPKVKKIIFDINIYESEIRNKMMSISQEKNYCQNIMDLINKSAGILKLTGIKLEVNGFIIDYNFYKSGFFNNDFAKMYRLAKERNMFKNKKIPIIFYDCNETASFNIIEEIINCSTLIPNLVLDNMEPEDISNVFLTIVDGITEKAKEYYKSNTFYYASHTDNSYIFGHNDLTVAEYTIDRIKKEFLPYIQEKGMKLLLAETECNSVGDGYEKKLVYTDLITKENGHQKYEDTDKIK